MAVPGLNLSVATSWLDETVAAIAGLCSEFQVVLSRYGAADHRPINGSDQQKSLDLCGGFAWHVFGQGRGLLLQVFDGEDFKEFMMGFGAVFRRRRLSSLRASAGKRELFVAWHGV